MTAQEVRAIRARISVTQAGLAELLGCSRQQVRRWENGECKVRRVTELALRFLVAQEGRVWVRRQIDGIMRRIAEEINYDVFGVDNPGGACPR